MGSAVLLAGRKITGRQSVASDAPAYQAGKDNYYAISAIAYDNKGNALETCADRSGY